MHIREKQDRQSENPIFEDDFLICQNNNNKNNKQFLIFRRKNV